MSSSVECRRRARGRSAWPGRLTTLEASGSEDLRATTSSLERLEMMWDLAIDAWILSGREFPGYGREEAPGRIVRPPAEMP